MDTSSSNYKACFINEYEKQQKKLYLMALAILKNPHYAEDAVQEAALKAYNKYATLKDPSLFSTWITRILINECKMMLRKNKNISLYIDEIAEDNRVSFNHEQWRFFELISDLNEKEKNILILRYFYRMPLKDIAKTLYLPLSTVKTRLYRALETIRKDWSEFDDN